MSWNSVLRSVTSWGLSVVLSLMAVGNVIAQSAPSGIPLAPNSDPFAPPLAPSNVPPPARNYVHFAPPMNRPPSPNAFGMPPQPSFNQYMPHQNSAPVYAPINQGPPADAAPIGATAPSSSTGEMEFESESGNSGGGGTASNNYVYPPTWYSGHAGQALTRGGYGSPLSLLDAYYQQPYAQVQRYYQYKMQQRRQNGIFGGMFGGSTSGNMFGALMLNEFMF